MISVAGMDDYHVGIEGEKRERLREKLVSCFEAAGMQASGVRAGERRWHDDTGPLYSFFGATRDNAPLGSSRLSRSRAANKRLKRIVD